MALTVEKNIRQQEQNRRRTLKGSLFGFCLNAFLLSMGLDKTHSSNDKPAFAPHFSVSAVYGDSACTNYGAGGRVRIRGRQSHDAEE
jgi:hypothetical protein